MSDILPLGSLFASAFLSATVLPGSSEVVLVTLLLIGKTAIWLLLLTATLANSLGGLTTVMLGRFYPLQKSSPVHYKAGVWLTRFGPATLLLSGLPVVGDLLCLLAGGLRLAWGPVIFFLCLGKALRYGVVTLITLQGVAWW